MQLLFQEFSRKIFKFSEGTHFFLVKYLVRTLVTLIILAFLLLIIFSILTKNYIIIGIILGILILGELAHYIRKSREKIIIERAVQEKIKKRIIREEKSAKEKAVNKNLLKLKKS